MEEKIQYYILFANYTQGLLLKDLLAADGIRSRVAPAPRSIQGELGCGMSLLLEADVIDAARECIRRNHAEYHDIVPLPCQFNPKRNKFC
ncbi:MAG: DUF3343 domain-containing protein [Lachnospiraceae bacterium]|nr:DUF3343 domain-containing protein [Lachnospiraceae bacterium]